MVIPKNRFSIYSYFDYKTSYISIPIHLRVKLGPVFALAGIAANFKVSESKSGDFENTDTSKPVYSDANAFDLPLVFGAGLKFLMFSIEARYHWGTQPIGTRTDMPVSGTTRQTDYTIQYLQLGASVEF